jgi:hypothetical protein
MTISRIQDRGAATCRAEGRSYYEKTHTCGHCIEHACFKRVSRINRVDCTIHPFWKKMQNRIEGFSDCEGGDPLAEVEWTDRLHDSKSPRGTGIDK